MPVYEIKNPNPLPPQKAVPLREDLDPAERVKYVERVGRFKTEWARRRKKELPASGRVTLSFEEEKEVRSMIDKVNMDLENHGVLIHLSLVRDEDGFSIDVYDCTSEKICTIVRDIVIDVGDLPSLLYNLQKETGLIIDKVL